MKKILIVSIAFFAASIILLCCNRPEWSFLCLSAAAYFLFLWVLCSVLHHMQMDELETETLSEQLLDMGNGRSLKDAYTGSAIKELLTEYDYEAAIN